MRFLVLVAMMFAGAGSAMATVTISVVDDWDGTLAIVVVADSADLNGNGDSLVAGIALDVSVDVGTIVAVTNFMATGESLDGAEGYGIYMGTITFTGGDPEAIADVGTPVAPATAPDNPGQLGSSAIVLEFGCLFNVNTPEAAPLSVTTLCTIEVSGATTVHLAENDARGGVVMIGGGRPSALILNDGTVEGCCGYPGLVCCYTGPDMDEWCSVGMPASWCNPRQCEGDADGGQEGSPFTGFYWVGVGDLGGLIAGWKTQGYTDPTTHWWIAADFDHQQEGSPFTGYYRVGVNDLNILISNWKDDTNVKADCMDW